jgi:PAS domain S-box-containing protein
MEKRRNANIQIDRYKAQYLIIKELVRTTPHPDAAAKLLRTIARTLGWDLGMVWLPEGEKGSLVLSNFWHRVNEDIHYYVEKSMGMEFEKGHGVLGEVFYGKKDTWVEDISKEPGFLRKNQIKNSCLNSVYIFPIKVHGKVVAVFEFYTCNRKEKDKMVISILKTVRRYYGLMIKAQVAETEREIAQGQLDAVFQSVPVGITVEERNGGILYTNEEFAEMFGYKDPASVKRVNVEKVFMQYKIIDEDGMLHTFEDRPALRVFRGEKNYSQKLLFINNETGKETWILIQAVGIKGTEKSTEMVVKTFMDITKTVEEEMQTELFLGFASHELKSPLASIKAYLQLMQRRIEKGKYDSVKEYLESADDQTDVLTEIINNYLDVTRLRSGNLILNKRQFNLNLAVNRVVDNFKLTAKEFKIVNKGKLTRYIYGDEDRISQVLLNLLTNAVKYSSNKKKIVVNKKQNGRYMDISVKDYGIGIPKKYHKEVFKLFRSVPIQGTSRKRGTGMGLSISQAIVRSHGGEISLKSKYGKGSEFTVRLPIKKSDKGAKND